MDQTPPEVAQNPPSRPRGEEPEEPGHQAIGGRRDRGAIVLVGRPREVEVGVADQGHKPAERTTGGVEGGAACRQGGEPVEIRARGCPTSRNKSIGIAAQPRNGTVTGMSRRLCIGFEPGDHAAQLLDGPSQPLAILLSELRSLRPNDARKHAQCEAQGAEDTKHGHLPHGFDARTSRGAAPVFPALDRGATSASSGGTREAVTCTPERSCGMPPQAA